MVLYIFFRIIGDQVELTPDTNVEAKLPVDGSFTIPLKLWELWSPALMWGNYFYQDGEFEVQLMEWK